jgi:parallel beta-helix repeat protein
MNYKFVLASYVIIIILFSIFTWFKISCSYEDTHEDIIIYINPNYIQLPKNETEQQFVVNISIYKAKNVYAYDFKIYYNNTIFNGTMVNEGPFLKNVGNTFFNILDFNDKYNSTHGRIWIFCTLLGFQLGANGTGTLATIVFQAKPFVGPSILDLTETIVSDSSANSVTCDSIDGTVYIGTPPQLIVPTDYPTIQQAIDAAITGTRILVLNGTYFEQLKINKTVSIIGENKSATIIDANNSETAILVTHHSVSIEEFTIRNAALYAINFNNSSFNRIHNNLIKNNGYGIHLKNSIQSDITNNLILENIHDAIQLTGTAIIANNTIKSNGKHGILLNFSCATITENRIEGNDYGISLYCSGGSILRENDLFNNERNFSVDGEQLLDYIQNIDDSNRINAKALCYLINQQNITVTPENFQDIGYLGIVNSTNIHVTCVNFSHNGEGILLAFTKNSTIQNVTVENNFIGIKCVNSQNNVITRVKCENNSKGIELSNYAQNNDISKNDICSTIQSSEEIGLRLKNCYNNTIRSNTIVGYNLAFSLYNSNSNTIYYNNAINNSQQVYADDSFDNRWDNNYYGNYWSNYDGLDENDDGIGDTPYLLGVDQVDHYPLMHPYIRDIAVTNVTLNSTKIYIGNIVTISILVVNKWYETETFNVTIYANFSLIKILTVTNLAPYHKENRTYNWNTSNLEPGNYSIRVHADILSGEVEINDNTYIGCNLKAIAFDVDFNDDNFVNALDLRVAAIHFGCEGDNIFDVNFDNIINIQDLKIIVANYSDLNG